MSKPGITSRPAPLFCLGCGGLPCWCADKQDAYRRRAQAAREASQGEATTPPTVAVDRPPCMATLSRLASAVRAYLDRVEYVVVPRALSRELEEALGEAEGAIGQGVGQ